MLEKLFTQHAPALHRYLLRKKCSPSLASDLVQDTFLRIAQLESLERVLCAPSYLFRVAHNLMIDHHRRYGEKRYDNDPSAFFATLVDETSCPEEQALGALELEHLESLLERMPPRTRDVFMLCRVEGMTHKETARYLRISTSSVQKHMAMALARIGRALEPGQEG
ncbi:sigma-70 family RNA polymerase sigma factor [Pseudomonas fluorescens]|uniref:RNA polymerase sigma factor n=2 Tax=Gammaproteobacteria TaxID=1236 RepID=A0ABT5NJ53_9PSED|nr:MULTISPECIES: RNA polymerase sigma factor [Pseudomonas]AYG10658.1 sigma-70 family RNA polymerase sigma factor [Pseudomonas fluorescens]EKN6183749.1 RNA polymerase sigma factor [Yersinia enterocolitica]MBJ2240309.1 RNA polymerase sigma factor [Pseudomonas sp. MF6768]MBJ2249741.1 RNA polymerase sigma factor [Pseudomonas sp. MF6784]MBJ2266828.1 RNA polymerase sigma factor [Pseudomonas sp. MF6772]NMY22098.1 RNA polymerase sigma factor [Pseudomonas sp. WS 5410]NMY34563.1 RNA polymerase sigma f